MSSCTALTAVISLTATLLGIASPAALQRTAKASAGWVKATAADEATAFVVVENGTMYDIYLVGAETEAAGVVEIMQSANSTSRVVREVPVAAFDRLEMSPETTYLRLRALKKPLNPGESITITLHTDGGERLSVASVIK